MESSLIAAEVPHILRDFSKGRLTYNTAFKMIFSQRAVLAMVLRDCVGGYENMELDEIERHIVRGPFTSSVPVTPGLTNGGSSPLVDSRSASSAAVPTMYAGGATEDLVPGEGTAVFDFYFEATRPGDGVPVGIHVDIEGQARYLDKYDMVNRAQYYCARLLSSQYGREFTHQEYNNLKQVYSVWFFIDGPKELRGSTVVSETNWRVLAGNPSKTPEPFNLMTAVFSFLDETDVASRRTDERERVAGLLG